MAFVVSGMCRYGKGSRSGAGIPLTACRTTVWYVYAQTREEEVVDGDNGFHGSEPTIITEARGWVLDPTSVQVRQLVGAFYTVVPAWDGVIDLGLDATYGTDSTIAAVREALVWYDGVVGTPNRIARELASLRARLALLEQE